MEQIRTIEALKSYVKTVKKANKSIGFVPTMGYLHKGHLSLMARAKEENDVVITSVYVNPTQFGPNEDLEAYPRDEKKDIELMNSVGVDLCFFPTNDIMYPDGFQTYIETQGSIIRYLCGAKREGHFKGVTTIVGKLFNLVKADRAYFGMKDAQQVSVIRRMVEDLNFDIEIIPCPIIREDDGLAMSSRNKYLMGEARAQALALKASLECAKARIKNGERQAKQLVGEMTHVIEQYSLATIDYIEIVNFKTLQPVETIKGEVLIALAVFIEGTRLIDNLHMEVS